MLRAILLVTLLGAGALAGCASPGDFERTLAVRAFVADYDLEIDAPEGPMKGRLQLELSGPLTIADADLELRPAYQLDVRQVSWKAGETAQTLAEGTAIRHHLDGRMLLTRTDDVCAAGSACWGGDHVRDWSSQGSPAPFGIGWTNPLRYHVDGDWAETTVAGEGGWNLPEGSLLADGPDLFADLEFTQAEGAPTSMTWTTFDPADHYESPIGVKAQRTKLEFGAALLPVTDWPIINWRRSAEESYRFLPGEEDVAFEMGITFREAYENLLAANGQARAGESASCALSGLVYWGGGSSSTFGATEIAAFQLAMHAPHPIGVWEQRYESRTPEPSGYQSPVHWGDVDSTRICPARPATGLLPAREVLLRAWELNLVSGVPCSLGFGPNLLRVSGGPARMEGLRVETILVEMSETPNEPDIDRLDTGFVVYNGESGRLSSLGVKEVGDLARLDSGTLGSRPLPQEDRNPLTLWNQYRCVPPIYDEGPL